MAEALDTSALDRWQRDPASFIEQVMRDPETGRPFTLLDCERTFLRYAYQLDDRGRLLYPEQAYCCPKKTGKTAFAAMHLLTTTLVFGGRVRRSLLRRQRSRASAGTRVRRRQPYRRGLALSRARGQHPTEPNRIPRHRCNHHRDRL